MPPKKSSATELAATVDRQRTVRAQADRCRALTGDEHLREDNDAKHEETVEQRHARDDLALRCGLGVAEGRASDIAAMAALDPTAPTNPVLAGETEMRRILDAAMKGRIG